MLLSSKWAAELGGVLQNDFTYITVPLGVNEYVTLNNELKLLYHVEDPTEPSNEVMYVEQNLGDYITTSVPSSEPSPDIESELWTMHFDGARSRKGTGAGIVLTSPKGEHIVFSFRLEFDCTNNIAEYEALLIGLEIARESKIKQLKVVGDFDLIVSQVKGEFVTRNDRLRKYKNFVLDTIELFDAFALMAIPREQNTLADSLAVSASTWEPTDELIKMGCKLEVIFRPSVPDNDKYWMKGSLLDKTPGARKRLFGI